MASIIFKQSVKQAAYSGLGTISAFAVNFLFAGLMVRFLGNDRAGYFIAFSSLLAIAQIAGGFGLTNPATKRIAELYAVGDTQTCRRLAGSVLLVNLGIGLVGALVCIVLLDSLISWSKLPVAYHQEAATATVLLALSFVVDQMGGSYRFLYAACQRQDMRNLSSTAIGFGGGVLRIVWLSLLPNMVAAGAGNLVVSVIWLGLDVYLVRRLLGGWILPNWCQAEVRPLVGFSLWELFNGFGIFVGNALDRLVLTTFLGSGSLPYYAIAQRFFQQIHTAIAQQFSFVFPLLAASGGSVYEVSGRVQDRARWFVVALGALLYGGLFLVGPAVLTLVIGADFAEKSRWPVYLVCAQGLGASAAIANYLLHYSIGDGAANAIYNVGNGLVSCTLAALLIPRIGYVGASIAQLAVVVGAFVFLVRSKKLLRLEGSWSSYWSTYVSPIAAFAVMIAMGSAVRMLAGSGVVAIIVSAVIALISGLGTIWSLEAGIFGRYRRLDMIVQACTIALQRIARRQSEPLTEPS